MAAAAAMPPNPAISAISCRLSSGIIVADARRHRRGDGRAQAERTGPERRSGEGGDWHRSRSRLNWPKTIAAMTWARRVSADPRDFYFADPKQLTPLPAIGTFG